MSQTASERCVALFAELAARPGLLVHHGPDLHAHPEPGGLRRAGPPELRGGAGAARDRLRARPGRRPFLSRHRRGRERAPPNRLHRALLQRHRVCGVGLLVSPAAEFLASRWLAGQVGPGTVRIVLVVHLDPVGLLHHQQPAAVHVPRAGVRACRTSATRSSAPRPASSASCGSISGWPACSSARRLGQAIFSLLSIYLARDCFPGRVRSGRCCGGCSATACRWCRAPWRSSSCSTWIATSSTTSAASRTSASTAWAPALPRS